MATPNDDVNWAPHLLWPDGVPEPTSSLLNMLDDDRAAALEAGKPDGDAGATSRPSRSCTKRDEHPDDFADMEPSAKAAASGKLDSQAAKLKANREKQRRAQLNNRYPLFRCLLALVSE